MLQLAVLLGVDHAPGHTAEASAPHDALAGLQGQIPVPRRRVGAGEPVSEGAYFWGTERFTVALRGFRGAGTRQRAETQLKRIRRMSEAAILVKAGAMSRPKEHKNPFSPATLVFLLLLLV